MMVKFRVRLATPGDRDALMELLPRLGDFPRPAHRTQEEIYRSDAVVIDRWAKEGEPGCTLLVAEGDPDTGAGTLVGFALVRAGTDPMNGAPSEHLEALAVAEGAEGAGVGSALMAEAERVALETGALTITLHVFQTNTRARELYERKGYRAEWIRYAKPLENTRKT